MKKILGLIFILLFVIGINTSVSSLNYSSLPQDVRKAAENGIDIVKAKIIEKPGVYGFTNKDEIEGLILGKGWQVHYIGADGIDEPNTRYISQLEDTSIYPLFLLTIENEGSIQAFLEIGTEGGTDFHLVGFSGNGDYLRVFESALNQFNHMVQTKGIATETVIYSIAGRYVFAALVDNTEYALPVPIRGEIDFSKIQDWKVERLWTSNEIIQVIEDAKDKNKPGVIGNGLNFTRITQVDAAWPWYLYATISTGIILLILFIISMVIMQKRKMAK